MSEDAPASHDRRWLRRPPKGGFVFSAPDIDLVPYNVLTRAHRPDFTGNYG